MWKSPHSKYHKIPVHFLYSWKSWIIYNEKLCFPFSLFKLLLLLIQVLSNGWNQKRRLGWYLEYQTKDNQDTLQQCQPNSLVAAHWCIVKKCQVCHKIFFKRNLFFIDFRSLHIKNIPRTKKFFFKDCSKKSLRNGFSLLIIFSSLCGLEVEVKLSYNGSWKRRKKFLVLWNKNFWLTLK